MISRYINVASVPLALLCLAIGLGQQQQPVAATDLIGGLGSVVGGLTGGLTNGLSGALGHPAANAAAAAGSAAAASAGAGAGGLIPNILGGVTGGVVKPVMGLLGSLGSLPASALGPQGAIGNVLHSTLGTGVSGLTGGDGAFIGNNLRLASGAVEGLTTGLAAGLGGIERANALGAAAGSNPVIASGYGLHSNFKRQAIADSAMANSAASAALAGEMLANPAAAAAGAVEAGAATAASELGAASAAAAEAGAPIAGPGLDLPSSMAANAAGAAAGAAAAAVGAPNGPLVGELVVPAVNAAPNNLGRQALALDALKNAQAESALAGAEMLAHGNNNARSASLASNAYRQAKLASARDRVNIAGTIQNSARISDAAIATHDAATKAEDSLLGSELAVDSAATVLDSDAAYIPPVTSSLLRSLPYGRLGIRNIIPKPLTHPSPYLPDVWLNGKPVNYLNVPLKMYPFGLGPYGPYSTLNKALGIFNGQPFASNNGLILNGMVYDPAYAYMIAANVHGALSSSVGPILANGQIEAQDELAMANLLTNAPLNGPGMATTYSGYGRLNPVPMITGSVTDINIMPTSTIGTTYPIGSALVIEPRDSYFQDYNDNASSRQNMDERQQ